MADQTITINRVQIKRSKVAGRRPDALADGEEFVNHADAIRMIGDGSTPVVALPEYPLQPGIDDVPGLPAAIEANAKRTANLGDLTDKTAARSNIGLGDVNNTSDAAKPVSLAQGMAIAARLAAASNLFDLQDKEAARENLRALAKDGDASFVSSAGVYPGVTPPNLPSPMFIRDLYSEVISVRRFGASGDGSDQRVQLQKANNAAYESGKGLFWPKGAYLASPSPDGLWCLLNKGISWRGEPGRDGGVTILSTPGTPSNVDILYMPIQPGVGAGLVFDHFTINPVNGGQRAWVVDAAQPYDVDLGNWLIDHVVCLAGGAGQSLFVVGTRQRSVQGLLSNSTIRQSAFWEGMYLHHIGDGLKVDGCLLKGTNSASRIGVELEHTNYVLNGAAILSSCSIFRDCVYGARGGAMVVHNGRHIVILNPNAEIGNEPGAAGSNGAMFDFRGDVGLIQKVTLSGGQLGIFGDTTARKFIRIDNVEGATIENITVAAGSTGFTAVDITSNAKYTDVSKFSDGAAPTTNIVDAGVGTIGSLRSLPLGAGYTSVGSGYNTAGYYKDRYGNVFLEGLLNNPANMNGTTLGTLPVGFRPTAITRVWADTGGGRAAFDISPSTGAITWVGGANPGVAQLSLDGVRFRVPKTYVETPQTA